MFKRAICLVTLCFALMGGFTTPPFLPTAICNLIASIATTAFAAEAKIVWVGEADLQETIDRAPPYSVVVCDPSRQIILSVTVEISKPLTLKGLNARLPEALGKTSLLLVESEGVTISDFELHGNADSVTQEVRSPLLIVHAGNFRVERGLFVNSSKDGVIVDGNAMIEGDLVGGVIRDIVGRGVVRDVVSISGGGENGHLIRNLLIENIRGYDSELRGVVEVSNGVDNITVRKVYAERCVYGVDVQDHGVPRQINTNIVLEDIYTVDCTNAVRTRNRPHGHANLTMRDITAERCTQPLQVSRTENVILENVRVIGHDSSDPPIAISDCDGVSVRDVVIQDSAHAGAAILFENCDDTLVDGVTLRGETSALATGITYRITQDKTYSNLRIRNVAASDVGIAGILLERADEKGRLDNYLISGNLARVLDNIKGSGGIIVDNSP